jgi:hypothetical protein
MVTTLEIELIVFVVVLAVVLIGAFLYLQRRLRQRRSNLLSELNDRPVLNQDRAFNRLAMARREARILVGQGVDVHRAQELIAEAQGAFDTRQYDRAYQVAQSAHEALVNARQQGARTTGVPLSSIGSGTALPPKRVEATPPTAAVAASPTPDRPAIPKNRAESQFQLRLLSEELETLPTDRARRAAATEATDLKNQASAAFDQGDYTTAFRLALRGRRTLGGTLESLPPPGSATPASSRRTGNGSAAPSDATQAAEAAAGGERCPDCGYPTLSGDAFCRGCGRPRVPLTCPTCGAPRGAEEPFCGRCGTRFP